MTNPMDNCTQKEKTALHLLGCYFFFNCQLSPVFIFLKKLCPLVISTYFLLYSILLNKTQHPELPKQISSNNSRQFAMKDEYNKNSPPRPGMVHNFALRMRTLLKHSAPCFMLFPQVAP